VAVRKLRDDAPLIKKRLDPPVLLKKISDDVPIPVPAGRPPVVLPGRGGLSPFLLATGHHAAVGDVQGGRRRSVAPAGPRLHRPHRSRQRHLQGLLGHPGQLA
jgi:hypothetical protein